MAASEAGVSTARLRELGLRAWRLRRADPQGALELALVVRPLAGGRSSGRIDAQNLLTLAFLSLDRADFSGAAERLDAAFQRFGALRDPYGLTRVALLRGVQATRQGRFDEALGYAREALGYAQNARVDAALAQAHVALADAYGRRGDHGLAREHLEQAAALGLPTEDVYGPADLWSGRCRLARAGGDVGGALRYGLEALELRRGAGDRLGEVDALGELGGVCSDPHEHLQALAYYEEALALAEPLGESAALPELLGRLGRLCRLLGDDARALSCTERSLELSTALGLGHTRGLALAELAERRNAQGDVGGALSLFERAADVLAETGDRVGRAATLRRLGELCAAAGNPQGQEHLQESLRLARLVSHAHAEAQTLAALGNVAAAEGRVPEAEGYLLGALAAARRANRAELVGEAAGALYRLYKEAARTAEALEQLELHVEAERLLAGEAAARRSQHGLSRAEQGRLQREAEQGRRRADELEGANRTLEQTNRQNVLLVERLREQTERLQRQAFEDDLTGLYNRRYAETQLNKEWARAKRHGRPFCLAMADIDGFKGVNDRFSHIVGDRVLRVVADILSAGIRPADTAARYGGEEFLLLLPETDEAGGRVVCDKLRLGVGGYPWARLHPGLAVTLSFGLCADTRLESPERLLAEADRRLYEAKRAGRNRVR